jgi:hypothetical protein
MGSVQRLAEEVERGLRETHPGLRLTVLRKLSLVISKYSRFGVQKSRSC